MYVLLFNGEIITEFQPDREIIRDDTAMVLYRRKKLVITYVFVLSVATTRTTRY